MVVALVPCSPLAASTFPASTSRLRGRPTWGVSYSHPSITQRCVSVIANAAAQPAAVQVRSRTSTGMPPPIATLTTHRMLPMVPLVRQTPSPSPNSPQSPHSMGACGLCTKTAQHTHHTAAMPPRPRHCAASLASTVSSATAWLSSAAGCKNSVKSPRWVCQVDEHHANTTCR